MDASWLSVSPSPEQTAQWVADLLALPGPDRFALAAAQNELCCPQVVRLLLSAAEELAAEYQPGAAELARLALTIAQRLVPSKTVPGVLIVDLQIQCWILIGGEAVSREAINEAGLALGLAAKLLEEGSGDPTVAGALAYGLGLFHWVSGESTECLASLDQAIALFASAEQEPEEGAALIRLGFLLQSLGRWEEAAEALRRGIPKADIDRFHLSAEAARQALAAMEEFADSGGLVQ